MVAIKNIYDFYLSAHKTLKIRNLNKTSLDLCLKTKLLKNDVFFSSSDLKKDDFQMAIDIINEVSVEERLSEFDMESRMNSKYEDVTQTNDFSKMESIYFSN